VPVSSGTSWTGDGRRLRPGRPRGWVGASIAALVTMAVLVLVAILPATADRVALDSIAAHRTGPVTDVLMVFSTIGDVAVMGVLAVIVAAVAGWAAQSWQPVAFVTAAVLGSAVLAAAVKVLVHRPRPPVSYALVAAHGSGFPSEHAVRAVVVLGAGAVLGGRMGSRWLRAALAIAAVVLTALIGFSRVYLGVHMPSDVVAGVVLGVGWLAAVRAAAAALRDR